MDGGDLQAAIEKHENPKLPSFRNLSQVSLLHRLQILADAAAGLGHLHANKIVHKDVKPANILLKWLLQQDDDVTGEQPRCVVAKVGDCGISKHLLEDE